MYGLYMYIDSLTIFNACLQTLDKYTIILLDDFWSYTGNSTNVTQAYTSDSPPLTVYPTINATPSRTLSNGITTILLSPSTTTSVTLTKTQISFSVIIGIPVAIVVVAGTVVVTIIGLVIFKQRSNILRKF